MNCINFRRRHRKGVVYYYCTLKREEIPLSTSMCKKCLNKRYKEVKQYKYKKKPLTKEERQIYKEVSDSIVCQLCGLKIGSERHHIRYGACGRKTYEENIILLCNECHDLVHSNKKKYQPILIDILEKKIRGCYPSFILLLLLLSLIS